MFTEDTIMDLLGDAPKPVWDHFGSGQGILIAFLVSLDGHRGMDIRACLEDFLKREPQEKS